MKIQQSNLLQEIQRVLFLLALLFLTAILSLAQETNLKEGSVTFSSKKKNVSSENKSITSTIDLTNKKVTLELDVAGFAFDNKKQKEHFDSENGANISTFSKASFEGIIVSENDLTVDGTYEVTIKGKLTVFGNSEPIEASTTVIKSPEGIETSSNFVLNRKVFGIDTKFASSIDNELSILVKANY